ncbi:phage tail protein [Pseudochrobactrum lubricantis]|uniref:phage tail protein n=1 Tax=Pseudochrobactrum lubricantis TaxID=558172 RepID=UPI0035E16F50
MPLDANGRHTLPPVYKAITGTTVLAEQHNVPLEDISQVLSETIKRNGSTPWLADQSVNGYRLTNIGDPKAAGDAVNRRTLDGAMPTGAIMAFAGPAAPTGWLLCFGQAISRTTYSALFAVIGTTYGAGDGGTTFNLPDLRGRVVVGKDDMGGAAANRITSAGSGVDGKGLGANGGAETQTLTEAQMPAHSHSGETQDSGGHDHEYPGPALSSSSGGIRPSGSGGDGFLRTLWAGVHKHLFTTEKRGSGQPHLNMQPSIILNYIIRTGV